MIKKGLKLALIAFAAVTGLGFGYTLAAKLLAQSFAAKVSDKAKNFITGVVAFGTGLAAAVVATKLAGKFGLKGGPSVNVTKG